MKPYIVAVYLDAVHLALWRRNAETGATGFVYFNATQDETRFIGDTSDLEERHVFFCDSEADAKAAAEKVLELNPRAKVCIAKTSNIMQRNLGPIQTSSFSEKGLLPV